MGLVVANVNGESAWGIKKAKYNTNTKKKEIDNCNQRGQNKANITRAYDREREATKNNKETRKLVGKSKARTKKELVKNKKIMHGLAIQRTTLKYFSFISIYLLAI